MREGTVPVALTLAAVAMTAALLSGGAVAAWVFAALALLFPILLIALAVGGFGRYRWVMIVLALLLEGAGLGVLWLSTRPPTESAASGLPPATLLMLFGLGVAPLVVVAVGYAVGFERWGLSDDGLRRLARFRNVDRR